MMLSSMHRYTGEQFGSRTMTDLQSIVDDPASLLLSSSGRARVTRSQNNLDILSAAEYPHPQIGPVPSKRKEPSGHPQQFYGGFVLNDATSTGTDRQGSLEITPSEPSRPKKRTKTKGSAQEDAGADESKSKRGRPRLDTHDQTAADRRRTQIRLAQRAYRHRKETTITGLKQKVAQIQSVVQQMNSKFFDLHDNVMDAGVLVGHPGLAAQFEKMASEFEELANSAAVEDDDEVNPPEPKESDAPAAETAKSRKPNSPQASDQSSDVEALKVASYSDDNPIYHYDETLWSANDANDVMQFNVQIPEASVSLEAITAPISNLSKQLALPPTLAPPTNDGFYTYSFQETTFARRLHRLCLEKAFRNLTNPHSSPNYVARTFRFTFCFSNRRRMLARFQEMLKRKAGEALENFAVPFFHIGGAGTHYPRRDASGQAVYPPNMMAPDKAIGPACDPTTAGYYGVQPETPREEQSIEEILDKLGYGGLWFDSHDVEQYLGEKGIHLDGTSSFVEVDARLISGDSSTHSSLPTPSSMLSTPSIGTVRTPSPFNASINPTGTADMNSMLQQRGKTYGESYNTFLEGSSDSLQQHLMSIEGTLRTYPPADQVATVQARQVWPWPDDTPSWLAQNDAAFAAQDAMADTTAQSFMSTVPGRTVTIDVEKLLERMTEGAACLGRAPGFRKELVDNALKLSLAEAF
jgi:hypothetical protein